MQRDDANAEEIREKAGDLQKRSLSLFEIAYKKVSFFVYTAPKIIFMVLTVLLLQLFRCLQKRATLKVRKERRNQNKLG